MKLDLIGNSANVGFPQIIPGYKETIYRYSDVVAPINGPYVGDLPIKFDLYPSPMNSG